jgi:hypothetical protein
VPADRHARTRILIILSVCNRTAASDLPGEGSKSILCVNRLRRSASRAEKDKEHR